MAFALVVNVAAGSTNGTSITTAAINTTGADLLILQLSDYVVQAATVSDSKGNTWTPLTRRAGTVGASMLYYVKNPTVGSGHTFTADSGASFSYPAIGVAAFSGSDLTAPFEAEVGNTSASGTSIQPGSLTPAQNNELVIAGLTLGQVNTPSIDSSFTITDHIALVGAQHFGMDLAYKIQTTAGAENPTWSWATSTDSQTGMACFKIAAGATGWGSLLGLRRSRLVREDD